MEGLRCGIEIHQQLEGKKLFCSCPTRIIDDMQPELKVKRRLRAVVGETGEIDSAAAHEQARAKEFIYDYFRESCCLVELDEEPPHPINADAVRTAYIVSKLLGSRPVDEVQVMRKTVVDGSNTTGFQRTALVAMDGRITTSDGVVGIDTVCLEEDAAKIVERTSDSDEYNLSRLGIPLIEIATAPQLHSPQAVREAAEKIGMILRSTGCCKRGLGTIRQDVNVSIKGGARVEIKGAQDLKMLATLVETEAGRQKALISIKDEMKKRDIPDEIFDLTDMFKASQSKVIVSALKKKGKIVGIRLPGFAGYIGRELQPGKRLGTEFSDYAKAKAGVGGIFHSDEMPNYGITEKDVKEISRRLGCSAKDGFVMVADTEAKAMAALDAVRMRALMVFSGVPKEVRRANPDGTSSYMRPMPGGARMYPETDVMPLRLDFGEIEMPKLIEEKIEDYEKLGLGHDLAVAIARSEKNSLFEGCMERCRSIKPAFIAETLISYEREVRRNSPGSDTGLVTEDHLAAVFAALDSSKIAKSSVIDILGEIAAGKGLDLSRHKSVSGDEIEDVIKKIVEKNKGAPFGALMGEAMKAFDGKVDGRKVSEILKRLL